MSHYLIEIINDTYHIMSIDGAYAMHTYLYSSKMFSAWFYITGIMEKLEQKRVRFPGTVIEIDMQILS